MSKRIVTAVLGLAAAATALNAGAFTREAGVRVEREMDRRQVTVSASRDGSKIRPGSDIVRQNGALRLDSVTVIEQAPSATVGGSLSQEDTGNQRALNGELDL